MTSPPARNALALIPFVLLGVAAGGAIIAALHGRGAVAPVALPSIRQERPPAAPAAVPALVPSDPAALTLLRESAAAERRVFVRARVSDTQFSGATQQAALFDPIEGTGGRYCYTYRAPAAVAGRVLLSDGKMLRQYEPSRNVILRRPLAPEVPPVAVPSEPGDGSGWRMAGRDRVAGRPAVVIARVNARGALLERRALDAATRRMLRWERFDRYGVLARRLAFVRFAVARTVPAQTFTAHFPRGARMVPAPAPRTDTAAQVARDLHLPALAAGYRVRSTLAHRGAASGMPGHHLLYSDGVHAVSVFVTAASSSASAAVTPRRGWARVSPQNGGTAAERTMIARTDASERTAVVWTHNGRRYVAVARMTLPRLLPVARALYASR